MWTQEHRRVHARKGLRYPSDLTDAEWAQVEPLLPPARRGGRPRAVNLREVLNAVFYLLSTVLRQCGVNLPVVLSAEHIGTV